MRAYVVTHRKKYMVVDAVNEQDAAEQAKEIWNRPNIHGIDVYCPDDDEDQITYTANYFTG